MQGGQLVFYSVELDGKRLPFRLNPSVLAELDSLKAILPDIRRIILTGNWPFDINQGAPDIEPQMLIDLVTNPKFPRTPEETLRLLFDTLHERQERRGAWVDMYAWLEDKVFLHSLYMEEFDELAMYFRELESMALIDVKFDANGRIPLPVEYMVTFNGLKHYIATRESGALSKNCFVAMSFSSDPGIQAIRQGIKSVLVDLNYRPLLVDEEHLDSDQSINDGIIALIKKSRFAVCDFTEQKDGVYFEAGYAAGRRMPVIYTCRKDHFAQSHFDTNHFPHIIYEDVEQLKVQLKNKIEAWITA